MIGAPYVEVMFPRNKATCNTLKREVTLSKSAAVGAKYGALAIDDRRELADQCTKYKTQVQTHRHSSHCHLAVKGSRRGKGLE